MDTPLQDVREHEALKLILEGTSGETGEGFFRALVRALATALKTHGAWVREFDASADKLKAFAFWLGSGWVDHYEYTVKGTPCEGVIYGCRAVHVPDNVIALYPDDPDLKPAGAVSYLGVPLVEPGGTVIGNLAMLDRRPMPEEPRALALIQIFRGPGRAAVRRRSRAAGRATATERGRSMDRPTTGSSEPRFNPSA